MASKQDEETLEGAPVLPDVREELLALASQDQEARFALIENSDDASHVAVEEIDRKNTARMQELVAALGWPGRTLVGEDGAHAAWLLVQHADYDLAFQRHCLGLMEALVATGEVSASEHAYLYDRVAVGENRPQRFGTQFGPDGEPRPIEDAPHVDERRRELGLGSMAEYREDMLQMYGRTKQGRR